MMRKQLAHYAEGSMSRYREIFDRSYEYIYGKEVKADSFIKFLYFEFLVTSATVETLTKNGVHSWVFLGDNFTFGNGSKIYACIDPNEIHNTSTEKVKFFKGKYDIFPDFFEDQSKSHDEIFASKFSVLKFDPARMLANGFTKFESLDWGTLDLEIFDLKIKKWKEFRGEIPDHAILKARPRTGQNLYLLCSGKSHYKTTELDSLFISSIKVLGLPIEDLVLVKDSSLMIPWQVKFPALLKRILASLSTEVIYTSDGIEFRSTNKDSFKPFFNLMKVSA